MRAASGLTLAALASLCSGCAHLAETPFGDGVPFEDASGRIRQTVLTEDGGRVDWSHALGLIAFDREGPDGFFDVWTMRPDGSDQRCFTCDLPGLPRKNVGQPAWHPAGTYLVVQVQKATGRVTSFAANPGRGVRNDLWAVRYPDGRARQLTDLPPEGAHGVLHPHFSADGRTLLWSEQVGPVAMDAPVARWVLRWAAFVEGPDGPELRDIQTCAPDRASFRESHGLSPDGTRWIFSANADPQKPLAQLGDIWSVAFPSCAGIQRITSGGYNEHATYTPDGARLVWMSSAGNRRHHGTDYWSARADGTGLRRLTRLSETRGRRTIAADVSVGPDGTSFVGYVQPEVLAGKGKIIRFDGL